MKILPLILGKFDTVACVYVKCRNETEAYDFIASNSGRREFTKLVRLTQDDASIKINVRFSTQILRAFNRHTTPSGLNLPKFECVW